MNKQEFIKQLQASLSGKVSVTSMQENIKYYQDYIEIEIKKGRSEEEVLAALGSPRLLAKTIISAEKAGNEKTNEDFYEKEQEQTFWYQTIGKLPLWKKILYGVGGGILLLLLLVFVFQIVIYIVLPIIVIGLIVGLIVNLIQRYFR